MNNKTKKIPERIKRLKREWKSDMSFMGGKTANELCREVEIKSGMTSDGQMVQWAEVRQYKIK